MSWKDALEQQIVKLRAKFDAFNQSLADKALPDDRKGRVGRLSLEQKASKAGHGKPKLKAVNTSPKARK
ncbi:hypothetical protein [Marinobacter caseinilyticus]|uniref:hypothetical protein n=1 Tax=Marinobacter caseinilyticus TaxID=2692195 RepID=UPI001408786E|nr:hypothetical protein [Marinobacter caseinilyticus]